MQLMAAGGTLLTLVAPFVNIQFLGSSLTFMMVSSPSPLPCCGTLLASDRRCIRQSACDPVTETSDGTIAGMSE